MRKRRREDFEKKMEREIRRLVFWATVFRGITDLLRLLTQPHKHLWLVRPNAMAWELALFKGLAATLAALTFSGTLTTIYVVLATDNNFLKVLSGIVTVFNLDIGISAMTGLIRACNR